MIALLPVRAFAEPDWTGYTPISSEEDLAKIADDMDGKYYLTQDITLTDTWTPIGLGSSEEYDTFDGTAFTGVLDGDGHTISGLDTGNLETDAGVGLFAKVGQGGAVRNLTLDDAYAYGRYWVGGVAGINDGAIENCHLVNSTIAGHEATSVSQYN